MAIRIFGLLDDSLPAADETWENSDRNRRANVILVILFDIVNVFRVSGAKETKVPEPFGMDTCKHSKSMLRYSRLPPVAN